MKTQFRQTALAAMLLAPVALTAPFTASAQVVTAARAPTVTALQMSSDNGLAPGSQLNFTVKGTPCGRASVRVGDGGPVVPLAETSPGTYQGIHTVRRGDQIDANGLLRASVATGSLTSTANYTFPPSFIAWQNNPPASMPPVALVPQIERFTAIPDGPLEPGAQIRFVVSGVPGGRASLNVPGVARDIELNEARPGIYRGSYTLRRQDNVDAFQSAAVTLRVGNQAVTSNLTQPFAMGPAPLPPRAVMGSAPGPLPLDISSHRGSEGNWTQLKGLTVPNAALHVRIDAVPPVMGNRVGVAQQVASDNIRADQYGNFTYNFNPRFVPAPGTRYEVSITADDGRATNEQRMTINGS